MWWLPFSKRYKIVFAVVLPIIGLQLLGLAAASNRAAPGDLDASFGTKGLANTDLGAATGDKAFALAVQAGGEILVAGSSNAGADDDFAVVRYTATGWPDNAFEIDGKVTTPVGDSDDVAYAITTQPDGKIVVAGSTYNGANMDFALVRYTSAGILDSSFNDTGIVTSTLSTGDDIARAIAIQSDNKIVVVGYANNDFAIARYDESGHLDGAFGGGDGIVITDFFGSTDRAYAIAIQPEDGKLVVAGFSDSGSSDEFAVARYLTNGQLDGAFNGSGKVTTDFSGNSIDQAFAVALQSDGKIVVAGFVNGANGTDDFAVARYNENGFLDGGFGTSGRTTTAVGSHDDQAYSVAIQPTGKIVVAGFSDNKAPTHQDFSLVRYKTDGKLDTTFNATGIVSTDLGTINTINSSADQAYAMAIQPDNKIVVAGYSDHPAGNDNFAVVRYLSPNDPPTLTNLDKNGLEDDDLAFNLAGFAGGFSDPDDDDLAKIKVTSLPTNGSMKLNGVPVDMNQEIVAADLANLTFTPDKDWNGGTSFNWNAADGISYASNEASLNIHIAPVNDAPSFSKGLDQTAFEDSGTVQVIEWAANILAGPADESGQSLVFSTSSGNKELFAIQPTINTPTGTLSYRPAADINGRATVTVTLMDDGGAENGGVFISPSQTFTITIIPVNDAPSFNIGPDQIVEEDAGAQTVSTWAKELSPGPPDETGQGLVFTAVSNNNALFSVSPAVSPFTGELTFTPSADVHGSATITVTLMDSGETDNGGINASPAQSFTIEVTAVNDAPVVSNISKLGIEDEVIIFKSSDFIAGFDDIDGDNLVTVRIMAQVFSGMLKFNGAPVTWGQEIPAVDLNKLTLEPDIGWFGSINFDWNGSDGQLFAARAAHVSVTIEEKPRLYLPVLFAGNR